MLRVHTRVSSPILGCLGCWLQHALHVLFRVHVLERMCLSDLAEINTLHHQLHASQQSAWALREHILVNANGASSMCCEPLALPITSVPHSRQH